MRRLPPILHPDRHRLPLWMKLAMAVFLAILVPVYWHHYGPSNFLWFSDIALFFAAITLWTGRRIFACIAACLSLVPEIGWNLDFLIGLAVGTFPIGIAEYMAEADRPLYLRAMSLFHIPLPILLLYLVHKLGYDRRTIWWTIGLAMIVLPWTWLVTEPEESNINWVWGIGDDQQEWMHPLAWLAVVMAALPVAFFLPVHLFLWWWRGDGHDHGGRQASGPVAQAADA